MQKYSKNYIQRKCIAVNTKNKNIKTSRINTKNNRITKRNLKERIMVKHKINGKENKNIIEIINYKTLGKNK